MTNPAPHPNGCGADSRLGPHVKAGDGQKGLWTMMEIPKCDSVVVSCANGCGARVEVSPRRAMNPVCCCEDCEFQWCGDIAVEAGERRVADRIDGYDRDDLGESPDW